MIDNYYWELKTPDTFIVDGVELAWIPGYENIYAVSKDGKIWSKQVDRRNHGSHWLKGKQPSLTNPYIKFSAECIMVHRAVALTWLKNDDPENKTIVDHINRIPTDNRVENLRWVTHSENNSNVELKPYNELTKQGKHRRDNKDKLKPLTEEQKESIRQRSREYYQKNKKRIREREKERNKKYI